MPAQNAPLLLVEIIFQPALVYQMRKQLYSDLMPQRLNQIDARLRRTEVTKRVESSGGIVSDHVRPDSDEEVRGESFTGLPVVGGFCFCAHEEWIGYESDGVHVLVQ